MSDLVIILDDWVQPDGKITVWPLSGEVLIPAHLVPFAAVALEIAAAMGVMDQLARRASGALDQLGGGFPEQDVRFEIAPGFTSVVLD